MKFTTRRIAENLLFAANVFMVFLALFEYRMSFPAWLQSVGRMHPMFLHFPIVILLLAMGLEFFRPRSETPNRHFYEDVTTWLLLAGALFAAITAIMGLLLSKEEGYDSDSVVLHKWAGISIVLVASLVYWFRNASWYNVSVARISAVIAVCCVVVGGHFGAGITHGDEFISGPLLSKKSAAKVPADKAVIYTDVIQPIFASKCMGCHNSGKAKGGLVLDNPEDILKGGKNGKLFVPAHADSSLIIERINLPEEEKKHMPLEGKPQLSKDEIGLLYKWIQSGADFKKKLVDLPETDSLRISALKFVAPPLEEVYSFDAASEKTVHSLSNNYRVLFPVAEGSPGLVADFYNRKQFSSQSLAELAPVKNQIVELNLNKMPVSDADLQTIGQFANLRILNLNFTEITSAGISKLSALRHLKSLSISGTAVDAKAIPTINSLKSLTEVIIWHTGITTVEIAEMQRSHPNTRFVEGYKNYGIPSQLNTPILVAKHNVFSDTVHLSLKHPIPGAEIRYTVDGTNPDSAGSMLYNGDVVLDRTTVFKARAFKSTWLGSDSIMSTFYKSIFKPDSIGFIDIPPEPYKTTGPQALTDHQIGDLGFGTGKWLGFQKDMEIFMQFRKPVRVRNVAVHMMENIGADILPPVQVQVWGGHDKDHLKLLQTIRPAAAVKGEKPALLMEECKFSPTNVNYLKVIATTVKKVPKWGNSPKKPGWVFADEILIN
jgi:uncharacterized membrane protein/mono/diheme cytochrome c family protein